MISNLFVYGTLMPGQSRWQALAPWVDGDPSADSVSGHLFDTGCGWPAGVVGIGATIPGFTVPLAARLLPAALDALDLIEGIERGLFRRISLVTAEGINAWAYDWLGSAAGFTMIDSWI